MSHLQQIYTDRLIDEINAFHRDERKAQVKNMRMMAKSMEGALISAASISADPVTFVIDQARADARKYLTEQYSEDVVDRRTLAKG